MDLRVCIQCVAIPFLLLMHFEGKFQQRVHFIHTPRLTWTESLINMKQTERNQPEQRSNQIKGVCHSFALVWTKTNNQTKESSLRHSLTTHKKDVHSEMEADVDLKHLALLAH